MWPPTIPHIANQTPSVPPKESKISGEKNNGYAIADALICPIQHPTRSPFLFLDTTLLDPYSYLHLLQFP